MRWTARPLWLPVCLIFALAGANAGELRLSRVEPTVLFAQQDGNLRQAVDVMVTSRGPARDVALAVNAGAEHIRIELGDLTPGTHGRRVFIPDVRKARPIRFTLLAQDRPKHERTIDWKPQRHWTVHLVHGSHHDLGYTDIPSNVLREHDQYLDQVIELCERTADWPEDSRFRYVVEQTFHVRILPRSPRRNDHFLDAHVLHPVTEVLAVDAVAVAKQKTRNFLERERFDDLLSGPLGSRVCRHVGVNDAPSFMPEDHEDIQHAEHDRRYREEVDSRDLAGVVSQEGTPGLRGRLRASNQVLGDRGLGHSVAQQK